MYNNQLREYWSMPMILTLFSFFLFFGGCLHLFIVTIRFAAIVLRADALICRVKGCKVYMAELVIQWNADFLDSKGNENWLENSRNRDKKCNIWLSEANPRETTIGRFEKSGAYCTSIWTSSNQYFPFWILEQEVKKYDEISLTRFSSISAWPARKKKRNSTALQVC